MRILPHFSFDTRGPWDWKLLLCIESSLQLQQNKTKQKVDCWVSYITLTRNLKNVCTLIFIIYNSIVPVVSGQSISFSSSIRLVRQGIGVRTVTVTGSAFGSTILDYFLTAELPNDCLFSRHFCFGPIETGRVGSDRSSDQVKRTTLS